VLTPVRPLLHVAALLVGATAGLLGSVLHPQRLAGVPLGLLAALVLTAAAVVTGGMLTGTRAGAAFSAVGWVLPVLTLSAPRPEGDLVVPGTTLGYLWLLGGTAVAGATVAWPFAAGRRLPSADGAADR
jgi:hypothetical protein